MEYFRAILVTTRGSIAKTTVTSGAASNAGKSRVVAENLRWGGC